MPEIRTSAELRQNYNKISEFCHEFDEAVLITKNGKGDLAVMSMDTYDKLVGRYQLHDMLAAGIADIENNRTRSADDVHADIGAYLNG